MPDLSPDTRAIVNALRETRGEVDKKLSEVMETQRQLLHDVREIRSGFPGDDPDSHRRYHESVIEWRELRNKMVRESLLHAAKVGGFGGACWVAYALWTVFKMEVTR